VERVVRVDHAHGNTQHPDGFIGKSIQRANTMKPARRKPENRLIFPCLPLPWRSGRAIDGRPFGAVEKARA
jgi:hypothetical protein